MKRILILTATFGEGHNAAARNLREAFLRAEPDSRVEIADPFLEAYGAVNLLAQKAYLALINHAPSIWALVFHLLDRTPVVPWHIGIYRAAARRLRHILDDVRPDAILTTYPGCNHLLDHIFRHRADRPFRTITVVTDSLTINSVWLTPHSDFLIVPNDPTADVVRSAGVPDSKILAMGFPVPIRFSNLSREKSVPSAGAAWKVLHVVNSSRETAPAIVREILKIPGLELTVTVGRDASLGREIATLASLGALRVVGWAQEMPELMASHHVIISKAGGATVQESLAAGTPMIITQIIPGQEEGNARLVMEHLAGTFARGPVAIRKALAGAFGQDGKLWMEWHHAALKLGHPSAAARVVNFTLSVI